MKNLDTTKAFDTVDHEILRLIIWSSLIFIKINVFIRTHVKKAMCDAKSSSVEANELSVILNKGGAIISY